MNKLLDLAAAVAMVNDGDTVAFGGNVLYRSPIAAVKELIRQDKKDLHLVKTAIAYEVDLLCAAGAASRVTAGFVGYRREVLQSIDLDAVWMVGYGFQIEMKYTAWRLGFRVGEESIIFIDREAGESKMSSSIFGEAFFGVMRLPFRRIVRKQS